MSYEDKPMKKQWLEVDGRLTPVILPQIWNHEKQDWEVTSEQNPLPTRVIGSIVELIEGRVVESIETNNLWVGLSDYSTIYNVYGIDVSKYRYLNLLIANYTERPIELRRTYFGTQQDMREGVNRPLTLGIGNKLIEPNSHILVGNSESLEFEYARAFEVTLPYFAFHLFRGTSEVMGEGTIEFKLFGVK